ncbi:hypothetical protein Hanom_Chr06g00494571 [Helianthus anomalus]
MGLLDLEATDFLSFGRDPSSPPSRCRSGSYGTTLFRQIWVMYLNECLCLTTLVTFLVIYLRFLSVSLKFHSESLFFSAPMLLFWGFDVLACSLFKHIFELFVVWDVSVKMNVGFHSSLLRKCSYDSASVWAWHFLMQPIEAGELGLDFCWLPKLSGYVAIF